MGGKWSGHPVRVQPHRERRAGARTAHDVLNALEFTLAIAPRARVGRRAPVTLRLRNTSNRPAEAHFLGRTIVFDIIIARNNGAIVWRRLAHGVGPSILQLRTLAPGERLEWHDAWVPEEPGRYRAQGVLPSDDPEPRRTPWVAFDVSP